ncbi:cadmium-translocating P-type ATPase [Flaviflexus salsibiostraticola]|uniref:Cadmium-translocating P-type ATPase n=1 Tax=Flaviflexus salsibiostraticola TaxID=1282737 RepID=A0A3S8Z726_9ACTO|nr:cation-translocating P-type ATPase [Flaviflexus salsibiostraticola]AZN29299.1 cadmium-translocating P-type ATPase [Flaviflexus salsibiostraticola]
MSACGCEHDEREEETPWWRDTEILLPILSGLALAAGFTAEQLGAGGAAFYWAGLLLGGYTFAPTAVRTLVTERRLGIGLLMTISALGAIILGYVEEAAALAFLYSIVEALEDRAMDRARSGLGSLLSLVPETATVVVDGAAAEIPAAQLTVGGTILVRPGERVPTDGIVANGRSGLDTSAITGESIPVDVGVGDEIIAGSINLTAPLTLTATASGTDNSLTTVVRLVRQAQQEKGERARIADRIARPLVPGVLILAAAVAILGSLFGDPELWITRSLVVLVAASPCALAISVPLTVVAGVGAASRFGVVFKSGSAFEELGGIRAMAFDKTGTLTMSSPSVVRVETAPEYTADDVLSLAAALEQHSTHPLARAITDAVAAPPASDAEESAGLGMTGTVGGARVAVGNPTWLSSGHLTAKVKELQGSGMTAVIVHREGEPVGAIGLRDELRSEAAEAIGLLHEDGIETVMLTGDSEASARALASAAGIDDVRANLRPEDKSDAIAGLTGRGRTAMVGDGINDGPALASADLGIAMGLTGSDVAIESADIAFLGDDLRLLPQAVRHARRGRRIIDENILLSLLIITALVPLAISGVLGLAAVVLVHEVGEIIVILNGLRASRRPTAGTSTPQAVTV